MSSLSLSLHIHRLYLKRLEYLKNEYPHQRKKKVQINMCSGDRIPVVARIPHPYRLVPGPTQIPTQMVPGLLSGGKKRLGCGINHPLPSSTEVKERVELYCYSPSGPSWPVVGWTLPLPICQQIILGVQRPRVPALYASDLYLLENVRLLLYSAPIENDETLYHRVFDTWQTTYNRPGTFERVGQSMLKNVHSCIDWGEEYFDISCEF